MTGGVRLSGRMVLGDGDTTDGTVDMVGMLAAESIDEVEGELGIWSAEAEGSTDNLRPLESMRGGEAVPQMVSTAVVLGEGATVAAGAMEAGVETVETGDEVEERVV